MTNQRLSWWKYFSEFLGIAQNFLKIFQNFYRFWNVHEKIGGFPEILIFYSFPEFFSI